MEIRSGLIDIGVARLACDLRGEGTGVVLVHAGIGDRRMWGPQFDVLSRDYRVLQYDARGFGQSPLSTEEFSLADDLAALIEALDLGRVSLVGSSLGSLTAVEFAIAHPEKVHRLCLVPSSMLAPGFPAPEDTDDAGEAFAAGDAIRAAELDYLQWVVGPDRLPQDVAPDVRELAMAMLQDFYRLHLGVVDPDVRFLEPSARGRLPEVKAPALIIVGDQDRQSIREAARWMETSMPVVRLLRIGGAGHLVNLEQPERFNAALLSFLGGDDD